MNRTNQALMGPLIGIALFFAGSAFVFTLLNVFDEVYAIAWNPFGIFGTTDLSALGGPYWSLIGAFTGLAGEDNVRNLTIVFFIAGFALVAAGCALKPTWNLKGSSDDPKEYLFTHRPKAFFWCLMIPWNIFTAAWNLKKVPVILPVFFIPFMLPFALMMDIILAVGFLIAFAVNSVRIKMAAPKDKERYERDTQYAICPKCKNNFYQPMVKCRCGLVVSYPVPNAHGIKYHTCNNGHKLPSTNEDGGRAALKAVCPRCAGDIVTHEAKPLVISLVGSVGSGKTTMMIAAVESISELAKKNGIVTEVVSDGISLKAQRSRSVAPPTTAGELDSEYFFLRSRDLPEKEVIINDISGVEFHPDRDKILFEEYYNYNDGIILTIDPLEVMALHRSQSPAKGSKNTPIATLESFYHMFTEINGYGPSVKSTVPFAVVLTKMDDPKISSAVNAESTPAEFLKRYSHQMMSDIVESAFKNVRYFKVASFGDNNNAMEPFAWILAENDQDLKNKLFK